MLQTIGFFEGLITKVARVAQVSKKVEKLHNGCTWVAQRFNRVAKVTKVAHGLYMRLPKFRLLGVAHSCLPIGFLFIFDYVLSALAKAQLELIQKNKFVIFKLYIQLFFFNYIQINTSILKSIIVQIIEEFVDV